MTRLSIIVLMMLAVAPSVRADTAAVELAVIVNPANDVKLGSSELEGLFLKKEKYWGNNDPVIVLAATPDSEPRREFDRVVLGMSAEASARYWIDTRIRSGDTAPKVIADPAMTVKLVGKLKGAVAYVPATAPLAGVRVVARIRRGKVVAP